MRCQVGQSASTSLRAAFSPIAFLLTTVPPTPARLPQIVVAYMPRL